MVRTFLRDTPRHILLAGIAGYRRLLSPLLGPNCRFVPSCSAYAAEAIERLGPWRGLFLAVTRLLRCHPWGEFGYDPVPEALPSRARIGVATEANPTPGPRPIAAAALVASRRRR